MKIINAGHEIMNIDLNDPSIVANIYKQIERAGRTCYKSEDKITNESAEKFVRGLVKRGHEAMLEHASLTVKFIVDRGVSHELVRHRVASFAQESTRYCNYGSEKFGEELTFIMPFWLNEGVKECEKNNTYNRLWTYLFSEKDIEPEILEEFRDKKIKDAMLWKFACDAAESCYLELLDDGMSPEQARTVLPNSLKTEIIVTANMREWRHILKLRAAGVSGKPHPQMLEVMVPLLNELRNKLPALFDDILPMDGGVYNDCGVCRSGKLK